MSAELLDEPELEGFFVIMNARTLLDRLFYSGVLTLDWLSEKNLIKYIQEHHSRHKKAAQVLEERKTRKMRSVPDLKEHWKKVINLENRDFYFFMPLESMPKDFNPKKHDFAYTLSRDALESVKKSTKEVYERLKNHKILDSSYMIFLDELYLPFPIMPEKYNTNGTKKENLEAIPEKLKNHFHEHVTTSRMIWDTGSSINKIKADVERLIKKKRKLTGYKEEYFYNPEQFKRTLGYESTICKAICNLQMREFCSKIPEQSDVILLGYKSQIIDSYEYSYPVNYEKLVKGGIYKNWFWVDPFRGSQPQEEIVREGGLTSKQALNSLDKLIENELGERNDRISLFSWS